MKEINFLRARRKELTKTQQQDRQILKISSIVLVVAMLICIIIVGVKLFVQNRLNVITQAEQDARQQIISNEETEKTYQISLNKLKIITLLYKQRLNKQESIAFFTNIFGAEVLVTQIEYLDDEKLLTFRLHTKDVFVLKNVFNILLTNDIKQRFSQINLSQLRRSNDGAYEMTVAVGIKEAGG